MGFEGGSNGLDGVGPCACTGREVRRRVVATRTGQPKRGGRGAYLKNTRGVYVAMIIFYLYNEIHSTVELQGQELEG